MRYPLNMQLIVLKTIVLTLSGPGFSEHPQAEGGLNSELQIDTGYKDETWLSYVT